MQAGKSMKNRLAPDFTKNKKAAGERGNRPQSPSHSFNRFYVSVITSSHRLV